MTALNSVNASASNSKTQATLLERLHEGSDTLAWDEFFQRYWRLIYAYARRCNCSEHTSEEVVQDVMLKVFEQKDFFHYDPARGRFRDWLGTVVRNRVAELTAQTFRKDSGRGRRFEYRLHRTTIRRCRARRLWENAFEEALLIVLLDVVRREMTPRAYLAFELFTIHNMPGGKVAQHTGLTRNGVYRAHKRALQRLKELGAGYRDDGQLSAANQTGDSIAAQSGHRAVANQTN